MTSTRTRRRKRSYYNPRCAEFESFPEEEREERCVSPGCRAKGTHKAPDRKKGGYQWMCLEHVTEFNRRWNYFEGMEEEEIYKTQHEVNYGARQTWSREQVAPTAEELYAAFRRWVDGMEQEEKKKDEECPPDTPVLSQEHRRALRIFDLEATATRKEIKARYKSLVKKYHPDCNPGDPSCEDRLKEINRSYAYLLTVAA